MMVANARIQSQFCKILSLELQKKLSDFERREGTVTSEGK